MAARRAAQKAERERLKAEQAASGGCSYWRAEYRKLEQRAGALTQLVGSQERILTRYQTGYTDRLEADLARLEKARRWVEKIGRPGRR